MSTDRGIDASNSSTLRLSVIGINSCLVHLQPFLVLSYLILSKFLRYRANQLQDDFEFK
jgi:hypothetical protein